MLRYATRRLSRTSVGHHRWILYNARIPSQSHHHLEFSTLQPRTEVRSESESFHPPTQQSANADLDKCFADIRASFATRDLTKLLQQWNTLQSTNKVDDLSMEHYCGLSLEVTRFCRSEDFATASPEAFDLLELIAMGAAGAGYASALRAIMVAYIRCGDHNRVYKLYEELTTMVTGGILLENPERDETREEEEEGDLEREDEDAQHLDDLLFALEDSHTKVQPRQARHSSPFMSDLLMAAIAAAALQDDFRKAFGFAHQARGRLIRSKIGIFVNSLGDTPLSSRIESFLWQAATLQLLTQPRAFNTHISNLIKDNSAFSLQTAYSHVIQGLTGEDPCLTVNPELVSERIPVLVPPEFWQLFLSGFLHCQREDLAEQLWDDMVQLGVTPTMHVWITLIDAYAQSRKPDRATTAWKLMVQQGLAPTTYAYRAIIHALSRSGRIDEALAFFKTFQRELNDGRFSRRDSGVRIVFNSTVQALLARSKEREARLLLEQMEKLGPQPDIKTINILLQHYRHKLDNKGIADVLQKMRDMKLEPNDHTYCILLTALLPARKDAVAVVLDFMRKHGREPNVVIKTAIIDALMNEQTQTAFDTALAFLEQMRCSEDVNMRPNLVTYTSVLTGIHRLSFLDSKAKEEYSAIIAGKMRKDRLMHNRTSYNILIGACIHDLTPDGAEAAMRYYREMVRRRIPLTPDTCHLLLSGMVKRREWALANALADDLETRRNVTPHSLGRLVAKIRQHSVHNRSRHARTQH